MIGNHRRPTSLIGGEVIATEPFNESAHIKKPKLMKLYSEHITGDGERLFRELEKRKLEGMVAKRADSLYVGGRTRAWLKIKTKAGREEMQIRSETWGHPKAPL